MAETGKYIYGIVIPNNSRAAYGGCPFEEKRFIPYKDVAALVAEREIVSCAGLPTGALGRLLVEHQKTIEKVMTLGYTVIPVKLGTFAADETGVTDILEKGYALVKDLISCVTGKIEIDVVATWGDFTAVINEVKEEKEIKEFRKSLTAAPKGVTVEDQMKVGMMVKNALDRKREKCAFEIHSALKAFCDDIKQHELMDDKMALNSAFRMDAGGQKSFHAEIERLNAVFEDKLNFRCVGPLPLYSFHTLEVKNLRFADVDRARKRMGIADNPVTESAIKRVYHKQAFVSHPDKNTDKPEMSREFDELKKSHNILLEYSQACRQAGKKDLSFDKNEFARNGILVKDRC